MFEIKASHAKTIEKMQLVYHMHATLARAINIILDTYIQLLFHAQATSKTSHQHFLFILCMQLLFHAQATPIRIINTI